MRLSESGVSSEVAGAASRRSFVVAGLAAGLIGPALAGGQRAAWAGQPKPEGGAAAAALSTSFADVVELGADTWAIISKGGRQTQCNGGIVAGRDGVLVVEGFGTAGGGGWAAETARKLTGRAVTHVVLTHYHADHADGLTGYALPEASPRIICSAGTHALLAKRYSRVPDARFGPPPAAPSGFVSFGGPFLLPDTTLPDERGGAELDLGGRTVKLVVRRGHTPSDLTVEVAEPRVVFGGDLLFNRFFPYYGDAIPTVWRSVVRQWAAQGGATTFVPGHGPLAKAADLPAFVALMDALEAAAKAALDAGRTAEAAAGEFKLPAEAAGWLVWAPWAAAVALEAWMKELKGG